MQTSLNNIDPEPSLPVAVYYATESWHSERIRALAIYCSDGRWGEAFDEFCHRHLQIPRYDRLAVPGGPAWLVPVSDDNDFRARATGEELDFLVRAHQLERIVLIAHYGCALYVEQLQRAPQECLPRQLEDVRIAAQALCTVYPALNVEGYLAMRRDNCLSFHAIDVLNTSGRHSRLK